MKCLSIVLLAALLLLQCGDIETNPGPRKSVSKAPSAEDKINGLASTLSDYEAKIQGTVNNFNINTIVSRSLIKQMIIFIASQLEFKVRTS